MTRTIAALFLAPLLALAAVACDEPTPDVATPFATSAGGGGSGGASSNADVCEPGMACQASADCGDRMECVAFFGQAEPPYCGVPCDSDADCFAAAASGTCDAETGVCRDGAGEPTGACV